MKQPEYLRIYYLLRNRIRSGAYAYGQRLPSGRALSETEGVSVITVSHAYDLLIDEGYVESRERSGFFVSYNPNDPFQGEAAAGEGRSLPMGDSGRAGGRLPRELSDGKEWDAGDRVFCRRGRSPGDRDPYRSEDRGGRPEPDSFHFPFPAYARAVRKALSEEGEGIFCKSENQGREDLRVSIASYLRRNRGMEVSPGQILVGSGAEYLYGIAVMMLGRDEPFAIEDPSYAMIEKVYRSYGVRLEKLRMGRTGIRSQDLSGTGARVLHVTPFHSFPSGVTADASKRAEYIRWALRRDGTIIEDDYDSEFTVRTRREETLFSMEPFSHVIYINTFSRTISRSLRVGYMVLPAGLAQDLLRRVNFFSCTVPVLDQVVLRDLLDSGEFERHINRARRQIRRKERLK